MSFDEAIGLDEEFAHDGDQGDFAGFASLAEPPVEAGKGRMVFDGDQSGHVEGFADGGSAAPDFSLAAPLAAVTVEGGQSGHGSDGLSSSRRMKFIPFTHSTLGIACPTFPFLLNAQGKVGWCVRKPPQQVSVFISVYQGKRVLSLIFV